MALQNYRLNDTVLLAFTVIKMDDPNDVVLEMSNGDRHHFTDAQIKLAGLEPNPAGSVPTDTTVAAPPPDAAPDQTTLNPA